MLYLMFKIFFLFFGYIIKSVILHFSLEKIVLKSAHYDCLLLLRGVKWKNIDKKINFLFFQLTTKSFYSPVKLGSHRFYRNI